MLPSPSPRAQLRHRAAVPIAGFVLALILGSSAPVRSDSSAGEPLTLERAIELAEEGNRGLAGARARRDGAAAGVDQARAERRPRLDLGAALQWTDNPTLVFSNKLAQGRFTADDFALDSLNHPDGIDHFSTHLSLRQPLWTGGRLRAANALAERGLDGATAAVEITRQHLIFGVIEAHSAASLATLEREVTRQALETAAAHVDLARDLYDAGLVVESDALSAEVREAEVRELHLAAASRSELSRARLALILGRSPNEPPTVSEILAELPPLPRKHDLEGAAARWLESPFERQVDPSVVDPLRRRHPQLQAARHAVEAAELRRRLATNRRPEAGFEARFETNGSDPARWDEENVTLGVGLSWNLDGQRRRARGRAADAALTAEREALAELDDRLALDLRNAVLEGRTAQARRDQTVRGIALAEKSLLLVRDRYREGLVPLTELLDTETALTRARLRDLAARRDLLLAEARLRLALGLL